MMKCSKVREVTHRHTESGGREEELKSGDIPSQCRGLGPSKAGLLRKGAHHDAPHHKRHVPTVVALSRHQKVPHLPQQSTTDDVTEVLLFWWLGNLHHSNSELSLSQH